MINKIMVIIIVICITGSSAYAFLENYNNYQYLIGDRAAGLGGAYSAIANDSTALWLVFLLEVILIHCIVTH